MTTWYFFHQRTAESKWEVALASERSNIVKKQQPPFTTILDVDNSFEADMTADEHSKVRYRGPFYIDLDSDDAEEVLADFKVLLAKLEDDYEIDLDQVALYATGGRGYHLVFPPEMFMSKVPPRGMEALPLVYGQMALKLYVDSLDLNIYSTKKGRMFREKNVERVNKETGEKNGRFKVQITTQEAKEMTVELYKQLCSTRRHLEAPQPTEYNPRLALDFSTSQGMVDAAIKKRKNSKADTAIIESFGGKVPPTLLSVMSGENLADGAGFGKIAMQVAIAAHAMLMTEDAFIEACEGLIANHRGDGQRYGSPSKRRSHLRMMYGYMKGNPCYNFSIGGIKSLVGKDVRTPDLDIGSLVDEVNDTEGITQEEEEFSISQGIRVLPSGIYRKTAEGVVKVSALGMGNPRQLVDLQTGEVHGYEVDISIDGQPGRPKVIGMDAFTSRNAFLKVALSAGSCNVALTDAQIGAIADIFRVRAMQNNQQVYTVRREGIDLVTTPDGKLDVIWADQFGVVSNYGMNYRLTGSMTEDLQFRTDLRNAPDLEDTLEAREFFTNLFQVNRREVVARVFGFMLSTYLSQMIRHLFNKYPFMQVYGPAGSGKSETVKLFARLHYFRQEPMMSSALDSTKFVYEEMATCSGSIPFIMEEFKPREMRRDLLEKAKGILRSNYNGDTIGKGSVNSSTGQSKLMLTRVANRSPIVTIGEAIISQTAILDRCVAVPITKEGKKGRREALVHCQDNREYLSALGRKCVAGARVITMEGLRDTLEKNMAFVREQVGPKADDNDRPLYNVAVLLTGLEFGRRILKSVFGDTFNPDFEAMRTAVTEATEDLIPRVVSEAAKVLDQMAHLSRYGDNEATRLFEGEDYVYLGSTVQLRIRNCFIKYARHTRAMGGEVLYDTYEAFYNAMTTYHGTIDKLCTESPLKDSAATAVFEFSTTALAKDNVEEFKH